MSKKCDIWNNNSSTVLFFGDKGKGMIPMLNHACEIHKEFLEIIGVKRESIIDGDYYALLKAPFALNYMPMCKQYGVLEENFNL